MSRENHTEYMKEALALAEKGIGFTSPNPFVGAVVVKDGLIVGRGFHEAAGRAHAEVNAIDDAGEKAAGATIYVTLEPCNHTGKTPPCTRKILDAGISRVVSAMNDPNPHVKGGGHAFLKENGIEVITGICEEEAVALNQAFIKYIRTKIPYTVLKVASTLDGRIASRTGDSRWVTGEAAREYAHRLRHASDAILVGIGTVNADDPSLTTRIPGFPGKDPVRVILDTRLSISPSAKILNLSSESETWIITADPEAKREIVEKTGAKIILGRICENGRIDIAEAVKILGEKGITSLLIEGGGRVVHSALKAGIVDRVDFMIAPKIFGGDDGIPVCRGEGPALMADALTLKNVRTRRFGDDMMIQGEPCSPV